MKYLLSILFSSIIFSLSAQDNSKVTVFSLIKNGEDISISNPLAVPHGKGYNNQPSFISNEKILIASFHLEQIDILSFDVKTGEKARFEFPLGGDQFSPQLIPDSEEFATVRLDTSGIQRLYKYSMKNKEASPLLDDISVAYFAFYDQNEILATVLNEEKMDLVRIDLNSRKTDTLFHDAGRFIQKIPGTDTMSYTLVNPSNKMDIYGMDMSTGESYFITELSKGVLDGVWIDDSRILMGIGHNLYLFDTFGEGEWEHFASLEDHGISGITRMAISPDGKSLAIVSNQP